MGIAIIVFILASLLVFSAVVGKFGVVMTLLVGWFAFVCLIAVGGVITVCYRLEAEKAHRAGHGLPRSRHFVFCLILTLVVVGICLLCKAMTF